MISFSREMVATNPLFRSMKNLFQHFSAKERSVYLDLPQEPGTNIFNRSGFRGRRENQHHPRQNQVDGSMGTAHRLLQHTDWPHLGDRRPIIYPNIYRECNQYFVCVLFKRTKGFISESLFYVENGIPSLNLPTSLALRCELRCDHE